MRNHGRPKNDEDAVYLCAVCNKSFSKKENLVRHMKSHENARRYHCDMCDSKFNTGNFFNNNIHQRANGLNVFCFVCLAILLRRHKMLHVFIKCGICSKEFQFRRQYRSHHKIEHPNMKKVVQMIQETSQNEIIITNEVSKINQTVYYKECAYCSKIFKSCRGFKEHMCRKVQNPLNEQNNKTTPSFGENNEEKTKTTVSTCEVCKKNFKSKKGFMLHRCKLANTSAT